MVDLMKGHVGGGSGSWRPSGVGISVKAKSFICLNMQTHLYIVQERLLEMLACVAEVFPLADRLDMNLRV